MKQSNVNQVNRKNNNNPLFCRLVGVAQRKFKNNEKIMKKFYINKIKKKTKTKICKTGEISFCKNLKINFL